MAPIPPTSRARLWRRFFAGLLCLGVVALFLSEATGHRFLVVLVAVVGGALIWSSLGLVWLTLWALRKDSRLGQFGLGSLFFLTLFVALYLGLVRWTVVAIEQNSAWPVDNDGLFVSVAVAWLFALIVAAPFVLGMTESLLWFVVWILRRRPIGWLLGKRRTRDW